MTTLINLVPGAWDLQSFFENASSTAATMGNAFLILMGTIAVIYGGFLLVRKLMSGQQNQDSWVKIVLLIIIGGALMFTGFRLLSEIAEGGQGTIRDLGNATMLMGSYFA